MSASTASPSSANRFELRDLVLDGEGPYYDQIYRALRAAILDGRVPPGTRLPTTRALAQELSLSRNTIVSAFEPLRAEGFVVTRVGSGTFVAPQRGSQSPERMRSDLEDRTPSRPAPSTAKAKSSARRLSRWGHALEQDASRALYDRALHSVEEAPFDFRPCVPDVERLGYGDWRRALSRSAHHLPASGFDYPDPAGLPALREAVARYLARARGVRCTASEILIVSGVAQAIDLATRLLVDPGDAVLLENPGYQGARRAFQVAGADVVAAPVDASGVDLARVDPERLAACRLAYVTPSHQFPTGSILSLERRRELLSWASQAEAFIFEDDYDSEFRYAGRAIPSLKSLDEDHRVLYVGTFSKTLLPALRVAYLVVPPEWAELFRSAKWMSDWASPAFEQHALARLLDEGDFERHLRRARTLYAASRSALIEAIAESLAEFEPTYQDSETGLHLLLRFPNRSAEEGRSILRAGLPRGLGLYWAAPCYAEGAADASAVGLELVMGFSRLAPDEIRQGVTRLAELLRS